MLWQAGQERLERERSERLTGLFVTARDAGMDVLVRTGQAKPTGTWRLPSYIAAEEPVRTTTARDATLARLGGMFPGAVRKAVIS
jgi:hypothetical protein